MMGNIPVLWAVGKPLSALPEMPALRTRALDEKEKCCRYATLLVCVFLHEGIFSLLPVLLSRATTHTSSSRGGGTRSCWYM
jgi:hypothetical protein